MGHTGLYFYPSDQLLHDGISVTSHTHSDVVMVTRHIFKECMVPVWFGRAALSVFSAFCVIRKRSAMHYSNEVIKHSLYSSSTLMFGSTDTTEVLTA